MSRSISHFSGLFLFIITGICGCIQDEQSKLLLRQVMREENGRVQKRVYRLADNPAMERIEIYYDNGKLKEVYYRKDGQLEGERTLFFENGMVSETGSWHNDNRIGEFRYYRVDGKLDCVQHYGLLGSMDEAQ